MLMNGKTILNINYFSCLDRHFSTFGVLQIVTYKKVVIVVYNYFEDLSKYVNVSRNNDLVQPGT